MKKVFSLLIIAASFLSACYYDNFKELNPFIEEAVCDTASSKTISFAAQVVPILQNQCGTGNAICHKDAVPPCVETCDVHMQRQLIVCADFASLSP